MKKLIIFLLSMVLWQNLSFANRQHVHQRLVIEGYNLLKKWIGNNSIPIMNNKIGDYSNIGINPWEQGFLTTGAWREDVEDVVYHYSLNNPPAISGFTANLVQALGWALGNDNNDGWISITHFWDADAGDESATNMNGSFYIFPTHNVWQVTVPNAYQKMKHYANGDFDLRIQIMIRDFPNGNGVPCAAQWAWVNFRYGYLPTYFNTKVLRVSKIEWGDGSVTNYPNLPIFTDNYYYGLNPQSYTQFKDNICWEVLGRMCHLLQDMGVPAHANVDPHGDNSDLRIDSFENNFGDIGWTADMVYSINQDILDPFVCSNPIHFLMYTTQQQANHFASNGPHMHQRNDVFAGNFLPEEIAYLNTLNVSNYGNPIEMGETLTIENISNKMIPQMIRATAGLLYWFAKEGNLLHEVNFQNNFSGVGNIGNIIVNNNQLTSPTANFTVSSGNSITVTSLDHTFNFIDYTFSQWSNGDQNRSAIFYPTASTTYTANFIGRPSNLNRNLYFSGTVGGRNPDHITLNWTDNPNVNVTHYQIIRKVKHNGLMGPEIVIGTVNRGINVFVDESYVYTSNYTNDLLMYDVRGYFSLDQTYSNPAFETVFGKHQIEAKISNDFVWEDAEILENSIDNYPNPFNPSTIIRYRIINPSYVTLKVYDMTGRELETLVNKGQDTGQYEVNFDASHLANGVYFYRISAGDFNSTKKMILIK